MYDAMYVVVRESSGKFGSVTVDNIDSISILLYRLKLSDQARAIIREEFVIQIHIRMSSSELDGVG